MADFSDILNDARWLPHGFDPQNRAVTFIRLDRDRLSAPAFLADAVPGEGTQPVAIPLADIAAANIPQSPLHFVFHTAFCRSTLMTRALQLPGTCAALSEPGILAKIGGSSPDVLPQILRLLGRGWGEGESVFVKPTNHANALIPAIMEARPDARAVLMTNPLPSFLSAVTRKGMMGRRWARQLYLEVMGYAGMDLGMDGAEQFAMTDLQCAALAWFLNQRYWDALSRKYGDRVRILDGDHFGAEPASVLSGFGAFAGVAIDADRAQDIANGPVFTADAKTGEDYAAKAARDAAATQSAVVDEEIAKVGEWIGMIAKQVGITVPVKSTLV
ncbi:hypothetical protein [Erythrobacter sp. Alg231-14]|uniref:hypothetical protein n=1 Tax=Erythrobacter sp. Alg231-14 TaxID=1922225 RepID=UPI000D55E6C9